MNRQLRIEILKEEMEKCNEQIGIALKKGDSRGYVRLSGRKAGLAFALGTIESVVSSDTDVVRTCTNHLVQS